MKADVVAYFCWELAGNYTGFILLSSLPKWPSMAIIFSSTNVVVEKSEHGEAQIFKPTLQIKKK